VVWTQNHYDSLSEIWPQNHRDDFSPFGLKIGDDGFSRFDHKTGGGGFPDLDLKIDIYDFMIWGSKSSRRFLDLIIKTKQTTVCRLCHKTDEV
jgi:hypothetical protein